MTDDNPHRRGGKKRSEILPPEKRSAIARQGGLSRWADLPLAIDEGDLPIGGAIIPCAVLETKERVLTQSGVMRALGRARQAKGRSYYDGDVNLPAFITAKNLKPYIPNELYVTSSQIEFRTKRGTRAFGYPAELLTAVCRVFVQADDADKLTKAQKHVADRARVLLKGLENVGIIALIDEATGYQKKRPRDELQKILAAYISPELLPWTERFPLEFFKEMFRVYGWPWPFKEGFYPGPLGPSVPRFAWTTPADLGIWIIRDMFIAQLSKILDLLSVGARESHRGLGWAGGLHCLRAGVFVFSHNGVSLH